MDFIFFLIGMIWVLSYQFNKLYWFCLLPHPNRFFHFPNIILAILNGCKTNHIQILKGNINESTKSKMGTFQNQIQHIEKQKQTKKKKTKDPSRKTIQKHDFHILFHQTNQINKGGSPTQSQHLKTTQKSNKKGKPRRGFYISYDSHTGKVI